MPRNSADLDADLQARMNAELSGSKGCASCTRSAVIRKYTAIQRGRSYEKQNSLDKKRVS